MATAPKLTWADIGGESLVDGAPADDLNGLNWSSSATPRVEIGNWAKFPNKLFGSGIARKLGPAGVTLYIALCEIANRKASNTFKASDGSLSSETGLSTRTIRDKRIRLLENGLVEYSCKPGRSYEYTILNPRLTWLPRSERPMAKLKPRALAAGKTTSITLEDSARVANFAGL